MHDKIYEAELMLGVMTDTLDIEGKIQEKKDVNLDNLNEEKVKETLRKFQGKRTQIPPMYSAIKVKGKKLYEYARENKKVDIPSREIEIYSIELINVDRANNKIKFRAHVSKGTYIRTLCKEIAEDLGEIRHNV